MDDERCCGPRPPDFLAGDDWVWVWFPVFGIPPATTDGRVVVPASASCEVMAEGEGAVLCPSGSEVDVYHYGSADIGGDRLGAARCWRGKLVAVWEDCSEDSE